MKILYTAPFLLLISWTLCGQCENPPINTGELEFDHYSVFNRTSGHISLNFEEYILTNYKNGIEFLSAPWVVGKFSNGALNRVAPYYTGKVMNAGYIPDDESIFDQCGFWDTTFIVHEYEVNNFVFDYDENGIIDNPIPDNIKYYPAIGNQFFAQNHGIILPESNVGGLAPFIDRNGDGIYNPVLGDYPEIIGPVNAYNFSQSDVMRSGMEFKIGMVNVSGYYPMSVDSTITIKHKTRLVYEETDTLYDAYVALWSDVAGSCGQPNFVGCLPNTNLTFIHGQLEGCFSELPYEESIYFIEAKVNGEDMNSFIITNRQGVGDHPPQTFLPNNNLEYYNLMQGKWRDGTDLTYGGNGYNPGSTDVRKYINDYSDDAEPEPWKLCQDSFAFADHSFILGFGPYTLVPNQIIDIEVEKHFIYNTGLTCPTEDELIEQYNKAVNAEIVNIQESTEEYSDIKVKPNPHNAYFQLESEKNIKEYKLYDLQGLLIMEAKSVNRRIMDINTSGLINGMYVLVVETAEGFQVKKIVKQMY